MHEFYWEMKNLYLEITREQATPNAWNRREVRDISVIFILKSTQLIPSNLKPRKASTDMLN